MIKAGGFDAIDLNFSGSFFDEEQDRYLETVCINLQEAGLTCAQVHLPTYELFADSGEDDANIERQIREALRAMPKLKAPWGAIHARSAVRDGFASKRAFCDNVEWLKRLCGAAEQHEVRIAVENLPTFPDRPDAPFYSSVIDEQCEVIDAVKHPLLGACWDFGHANLNIQHKDRRQSELLAILGQRIQIVHVQNNFGTRDSHLPPALGFIDWNDAVGGLQATGFSGFFSLECGPCGSNPQVHSAFYEFCGKTTDAILEEAFANGLPE